MKNKIKNKSQSLLKVLQSLLHLPEQEQFVKTSAFLHERVSELQVTHMHYKTIEHNMKLIRKHNDIIYIMKQNGIQDKHFDIILWGGTPSVS